MKRGVLATSLIILVAAAQAVSSLGVGAPSYQIEDLGTTPDGLVPTVTGMNASGQVSGYVNRPDGLRAVRFTNGTGWAYLPGLDSVYSAANAINDHGDLAGYYFAPEGLRAFRYVDGPGLTMIPLLPDGRFAFAAAIAANGDVVGYGDTTGGTRAWRASVGMAPSVPLALAGASSMGCGVNAAGQMVGSYITPDGTQHAFRVEADNSLIDIVALDGPAGSSSACALDANGRVGGSASLGAASHAFVFGGAAPLDVDIFNSSFSSIVAIANGVSVGMFTFSDVTGETHALIHTDASGASDLNTLIPAGSGWILSDAAAVNVNGQIAGHGLLAGSARAFRLTPVAATDTTPPVITSVTATPSTIAPPKGQTVTVTTTAVATDDSGQAPACALTSITLLGAPTADAAVTGPHTGTVTAVGGRIYTFSETCVDGAGNAASSSATVTVPADVTAPVITAVSATPDHVWPPNGKMEKVAVSVSATDDVDDAAQCSLTSITSNGGGSNDAAITGRFTASVRAEKNGDGTTRVYALHVTCVDGAGNKSTADTGVAVSKDSAAAKAALKAWLVRVTAVLRDLKERYGAGSGRR